MVLQEVWPARQSEQYPDPHAVARVQDASDKATAYNLVWSLPGGPDSWPESPAATADDSPAWLQVKAAAGYHDLYRLGETSQIGRERARVAVTCSQHQQPGISTLFAAQSATRQELTRRGRHLLPLAYYV